MKRQVVRRTIMYLSAYLFPVLFQLLSPVIPYEGIFNAGIYNFGTKGIVVGSLFVFAAQFIFSIFLGRAYCGWVCPGGAYQEAFCSYLNDRKVNIKKVDKIKFFIWVPWLSGIIGSFILVGGLKKYDFLYNTYYSAPIAEWGGYLILFGIVSSIIMIIAFIVGKRGFCHSMCWMAPFMIVGKSIGNKMNIPSLKLSVDTDKCIGCKICSKNCAMSLDVMDMVRKGNINSSECILCGKCVDNCPKSVIKYSFGN